MEPFYTILTEVLAFFVWIVIPAVIVIKKIRRKRLPSNEYTPFDDIMSGYVREDNHTKEAVEKTNKDDWR